jgi:chromosomal replication initiator protein
MEELEITEKISTKDPINIWKACLLKIKENVSMMTYNTWFLPIKPIELSDSTLKVQIPSQFFWEWIDEHFNGLITRSITDVLGKEAKLTYVIAEDMSFIDGGETVSENSVSQTTSIEKPKPKHSFETNLNPRYTFDNFIKGEGNQLARAAAGAISDNPGGTSFNPLFLYGGVGLGKTHLIQAIGNQIVKNFPEKKVIYLSSDIFTVEFVESIQTNRVNEFSNFYRSMDVLIIDDIQFLT